MSKALLTSMWTGKQAPPPLPPSPVFARIFSDFRAQKLQGNDFCSGKWDFPGAKIAPCPPYTPLGTIKSSRRFCPSPSSHGFIDKLGAPRRIPAGSPLTIYSSLSRSLIVGNTLCLRCARFLRGERQHYQRDDVGQHVVHCAGQVQRREQAEAGIHVA